MDSTPGARSCASGNLSRSSPDEFPVRSYSRSREIGAHQAARPKLARMVKSLSLTPRHPRKESTAHFTLMSLGVSQHGAFNVSWEWYRSLVAKTPAVVPLKEIIRGSSCSFRFHLPAKTSMENHYPSDGLCGSEVWPWLIWPSGLWLVTCRRLAFFDSILGKVIVKTPFS
jgi:hypothetical protein